MKEYLRHPNYQFLIDNVPEDKAIYTEEEALHYLLIVNRTWWNGTYSINVIDYEKLIYIEKTFPDNIEIQRLIDIIKENTAKNFRLRRQYIARLSDDIKDPDILDNASTIGFLTNDLKDSIIFSEKGVN